MNSGDCVRNRSTGGLKKKLIESVKECLTGRNGELVEARRMMRKCSNGVNRRDMY